MVNFHPKQSTETHLANSLLLPLLPPPPKVLGTTLLPLNQPNSSSQKEGLNKNNLCHTSPSSDPTSSPRGNFSIAATLTHSFLQSEFGDDPPYKGHRAGQKMCISAHDFLSAMREMGPDTGLKVDLERTSSRALEVVRLEDLKRFDEGKGKGRGRERGGGL